MSKIKLPKGALVFTESPLTFARTSEEKKFEMLAYSGKVIKNHWYWGDLIISLQGMKFPKPKFPILQDHLTDRKIGFIDKPKGVQNELRFDDITYVDTAESTEFQKLSKQGFPYEASIRAQPTKITRLREGEQSEVNGMMFKGPGTIWEESIFREASVAVFGYDSNTKSQAFSDKDEIEIEVSEEETFSEENETSNGGKKVMNIDELKKDHLDLFNEVMAKGEAKARLEFKQKETSLTEQNSTLKDSVTQLTQTVKEQGDKIETLSKEVEKEKALKLASSLQAQADGIWKEKLSNSEIPDYLHEKVSRMVSHNRFVKENALDTESFTKAVEEEIKDWETRFSGDKSRGFGTHKKDEFEETSVSTSEEDKKWEQEMAGFAGVELQQ